MKYYDLLHLYKKGELSDEIKKQVEADIEKQEAISDYLVDQMEDTWEDQIKAEDRAENGASEADEDAERLTQMINSSIRNAFIKMGMIVTAISLVIILFVSFGLSPLISAFYYNPAEIVAKEAETQAEINRITLDYMIYSDLTMPGHYRDFVSVQPQGFGKYGIEICQTVTRSNQFVNVGGSIDKGKLTLYNTNALKRPSATVFAGYGLYGEGTISEKEIEESKDLEDGARVSHWFYASKEEGRQALEELEDDEYYLGYLTFEKNMNFNELQKFVKALPEDSWCEWCGVNTGEEYRIPIGYFMHTYSSSGDWKIPGYPELNVHEGIKNSEDSWEKEQQKFQDESWCQAHMVSMLKYLGDQKSFLSLVGEADAGYKETAEYVESHDLSYYGIVVGGKKADLLKLEELDSVYGIYAEDMP